MKTKTVFGLIKIPAFWNSNETSENSLQSQRNSLEVKREILQKLSARMQREDVFVPNAHTRPFKSTVICPSSHV
jgi:hypothetical protein